MKMEYKKGLLEIAEKEEPGICDKCSRKVKKPIQVRRNKVILGEYGPKCVQPLAERLMKANEASTFGLVTQGMRFIDYFVRPDVRDVRGFERAEPKGKLRRDILDALWGLKDGQYLDISKEIELKPLVENWRKKGDFIFVFRPQIEVIDQYELSPKKLAKGYVGANFLAYAGIAIENKSDNRQRIWSLMPLIEGKKIAYLCAQDGIKEKIEVESDQGPTKVIWVPSTTRDGEHHRVTLKNLPVEQKNKYSRAFDFDYESTSEDHAYNNMPWSHRNMHPGEERRFQPVRPDKFACAALEFLLSKETDILVDPRPVVPSNLACKIENRALTRVVYGCNLLDGEDIEIQLWMSATKQGYDKMFN